jgi:hypothetical protein
MNKAMTDRETIEAVERDETIVPLVSYLRRGGPLTLVLRDWLQDLLEEDRGKTNTWFRLWLGKRQGSGSSYEKRQKHAEICDRVRELTGEEITPELCRDYARRIDHLARPVVVGTRTTFLIVGKRSAEQKHKRGLMTGKPISETLACHITAAEYDVSYGGVRKILRQSATR